ncbi:MAG: polysaccharide deacetylase family protein [Granulosicoccus sp.]
MSLKHNRQQNRLGQIARAALRHIGVLLFHLGCARLVIGISSKRTRALLYHAVEEKTCSYTRGLGVNVPPQTFATHLDYFKTYYNVVSMSDLLLGKPRPRSLVITFDDGYASVEKNAVPQLEKRALPATVYLIGRAVKGKMVWVNRLNQAMNEYPTETMRILHSYPDLVELDRSAIINQIQTSYLPAQISSLVETLEEAIPGLLEDSEKVFSNAADIMAMQQRGIEFGFHTNDHYNLRQCNKALLEQQLQISGMEELINSNTFAYPFGYFSGTAIGALTHHGYEKLMTVGNNNNRFSELHLDRSEVFVETPAQLFAQLEIEEPIMAGLRALIARLKSAVKTAPDNYTSVELDKNPAPETSKPR